MSGIGYTVDTQVDLVTGVIIQSVFSESGLRTDSPRERILQRVLCTQEASVRDALIKLGWTPPATRFNPPMEDEG